MSKKRPTQRTLEYLRKQNYTAGVVERFNRHAGPFGKHFDLFGCIDIISVQGEKIAGIQATSDSNHSTRVQKALAECPELLAWLKADGLFEVWSWGKKAKKDAAGKIKRGAAKRWQ